MNVVMGEHGFLTAKFLVVAKLTTRNSITNTNFASTVVNDCWFENIFPA
jgi:hypothetical protein